MQKSVKLLFSFAFVLCLLTGIAHSKPIVVGCDTNFMPFEYKLDGKYVGFDIDLWAAVAKELGIEYELQPMDFNGLIPALQTNNIDVAIAGMTIKSEREEVVDFAYPYYDAGLKILVSNKQNDIQSIADLKGKIVASKLGTTSADFVKNEVNAKELKLFPNIDGAYLELQSGGVDAVVFDSPAIQYYANTAGKEKTKVVGPLYKGQSYGMAFPQGSKLREKVSIAILKLKENGTYATIYKKWFGENSL